MTDPWHAAGVGEPHHPPEGEPLMPAHILANAKAYAALIGAICTGLLGVYAADTTVGQVLTVVSIVATAVVTWRVPNVETPPVE